jgi:hypothetical protein
MEADDKTRRIVPEGDQTTGGKEEGADPGMEPKTEVPEPARAGWSAQLRQIMQRTPQSENRGNLKRQQLKEDRTKTFLVLAGSTVVLGLVFFALFSSPASSRREIAARSARPNLGRGPGGETTDATHSVAPILNADTRNSAETSEKLSEQDIQNTAKQRPTTQSMNRSSANVPEAQNDYALNQIDFPANPETSNAASEPAPAPKVEKTTKASLVFVRSTAATQATGRSSAIQPALLLPARSVLSAGIRLVARLETPASSAIKAPVVAAIEYNYERDGEVVIPAGSKAFGELQQANAQGYVGIRFHTIQLPDETEQTIEGIAMGLEFQPLKGNVTGRNRAKRFLVQSVTGLGEIAAATVGVQTGTGLADTLSNNAILRERLANNVAIAGEQQLNDLAARQNIVVTVPGNTRFYIVLGKPASDRGATATGTTAPGTNSVIPRSSGDSIPSVQELRELIELRQELTGMYQQQQKAQLEQAGAPQ